MPKITESNSQYSKTIKPELDNIEKYCRCGVTEKQLQAFYKISKSQWQKYKKQYNELQNAINAGNAVFKTELVNKSYELAIGFTYEEETKQYARGEDGQEILVSRKVTTKYIKPDPNILMWLLINRFPNEYARDPQTLQLKRDALEKDNKPTTEGV